MQLITYTLAALALTFAGANALGINCRGSSECLSQDIDAAKLLTNLLNNIDPGRLYNDGEQIVCRYNMCAFLQYTFSGASGAKIQSLAHLIPEHGCHTCGSVPIFFNDGDNNVWDGELTFNYARHPCPQSVGTGLC